MENKQVTAQDFIDVIERNSKVKWHSDGVPGEMSYGYIISLHGINALLSRARHEAIAECESNNLKKIQESRREALREMDEAHVASEKAYQAFRMNGRCEPWASAGVKAQDVVIRLRQEYQQP